MGRKKNGRNGNSPNLKSHVIWKVVECEFYWLTFCGTVPTIFFLYPFIYYYHIFCRHTFANTILFFFIIFIFFSRESKLNLIVYIFFTELLNIILQSINKILCGRCVNSFAGGAFKFTRYFNWGMRMGWYKCAYLVNGEVSVVFNIIKMCVLDH